MAMHCTRRISLLRSVAINNLCKPYTTLSRIPACNLVHKQRYTTSNEIHRFNALHTAAQLGDVEMARGILEKGGVNINSVSETSLNTPLAAAVESGSKELVRNLIVNGADLNSWMLADGSTLLHDAIVREHDEIAFLLIQHGSKLNIANKRGITPLIAAIQHGQLRIVKTLLKEGAKVSAIGAGEHPLNVAAREGQTEIARELVNHGATFHDALVAQDAAHQTQHVAQRAQNTSQGAQTPCHLAAEHGHADTLRFLSQLPHASALTQRASDGLTPLHLACIAGHADVVRVLLTELGANANMHDQQGRHALYYAVQSHSGSCIRELLSRGARVDDATLALSLKEGNKTIIDLLSPAAKM